MQYDNLNEGALRDLIAYDQQRIREAKERMTGEAEHVHLLEQEIDALQGALQRKFG